MKFSIIIVSLNPGDKLNQTLDSILEQTYGDYEILVKDGQSSDGSVAGMRQDEKIRLFEEKDRGIYDAMNQAAARAEGDFILFLNCGDVLYSKTVLEETAAYIKGQENVENLVLYGDTYSKKNGALICSSPKITGFTCYRNIPCHQSCFYAANLCRRKPYELKYRIRADYDHFLWCHYIAKAKMVYMDLTVSSYEGGGFSESRENRKRDKEEHKRITEAYMSKAELFRYRLLMLCTLAPLRRALAENSRFSGAYHWLKERVYQRKLWFLAAFVLFFVELCFLVWPVGWAAEDAVNFLAGEGMWFQEIPAETGLSQEFKPQYANVKSVGVYFTAGEKETGKGEAVLTVTDSEGTPLFAETIPYSGLRFDEYEDVEVNLSLAPGRKYCLQIKAEALPDGSLPALGVCGTEVPMPENMRLLADKDLPGAQLLTRYHYTDAIPAGKLCAIVLICLFTSFGVAFGPPKDMRYRRRIGWLLLLLAPPVLGSRLELLAVNEAFLLPFSMAVNIGIMYLLEGVVLLCSGSLRVSVLVANVFLTVLYSANYFVYAFRGVSLKWNDLNAAKTAARVVGKYNFEPDSAMAVAWSLLLLVVVYGAMSCKLYRSLKKRAFSFAFGILLAVSSGMLLIGTDILTRAGFLELPGVNQQMMYQINGYLVSTCIDIRTSRVQKPDGYSVENVEAVLDRYAHAGAAAEKEELPHVFLIMNESFTDLRVLGNLELSQENMENFYGLTENTIRGYTNASGIGGGTANSEFEVFTGCSMGLLPLSYYPYQQCLNKPVESLVSHMEEAGYTTYSMHPETRLNYNRENAYRFLGFDYSLWKEDFTGAQVIHNGVSDRETYKKLQELFEERAPGEKMFVFDLTMQNHGDYESSSVEHTVTAEGFSINEVNTFLSLMKESDEAFGELIRYFSGVDEKVVICMYGDHQPKFAEDDFYEQVFAATDGITESDRIMNPFKTPFVIWANYDIPEQEGLDISMNYLGMLVQKTAGVVLSPYFSYLEELSGEYPVITVNGYTDASGEYFDWNDDADEFREYRMLQYNYLFDDDTVQWGY